ncbi:effector binding domain-containing protein [Metasolibacillus sp.]|uniref:GyrI-like domain-containing protein n=1 Tax=Metasolibacillus sp. TaxID=2703680 RepID=UPI0025DC3ECD|nr:effector binding domain-containing protein [Metasolibacillus sp.]MCT6923206.1 effector binding domain-containing protein [Metasolibacillus sp.]MCT6939489.1 effector binding domain-containing protein [Metasolibacillus sp.]
MKTTITEKKIVGTSIRTNNNSPETIGQLWEKMMASGLQGDIFAIYHNYESDFTGDYDLTIGTEQVGANAVIIPAGQYEVMDVDMSQPNAVFLAWTTIWQSAIPRAYSTDFEHYAQDGSVKIYLSVVN